MCNKLNTNLECEFCGREIEHEEDSFILDVGKYKGETRCENCYVRIGAGEYEGYYADDEDAHYDEDLMEWVLNEN